MTYQDWLTLLFNPTLPHGDINGVAIITWLCLAALFVTAIMELRNAR